MHYIKESKKKECIFCFDPDEDAQHFVLHRTNDAFVLVNKYPYTSGHIMVVPCAHVASPQDISQSQFIALNKLVQQSIHALAQALHPDGFNIGMNVGQASGAGVVEHIHYHIVPRWCGDNNFMPVIGGARVINEYIEETYQYLLPAFQW
jgi:ATP adenylyltransferase